MLSLPFFLDKRTEKPEPKRGQKEWDLFKTLTGKAWDHFEGILYDKEDKITEFNYEKFISPHALKNMNTDSKDFKDMIKALNMTNRT